MIKLEKLSFKYHEHPVINHVDLHLEAGEILCLLGPNGSGKTTLLKCILNVLNDYEGHVKVLEQDTKLISSKALAKLISYVPQKQTISFPYDVKDMVVMGRTCHMKTFQSPKKNDYRIAEETLDYVGMLDFKDQSYMTLSGGEAQLIMIARALAQGSQCMIMDEPTAHLDYRNELIVLEKIRDLVKEKSQAILMATHFPNHAYYFQNQGIKTKVAFIFDGKIQMVGTPDQVLTEANIQKLYQIESRLIDDGEIKHLVPLYTKEKR